MGMSCETTAIRLTISLGLTGPEEPALAPLVQLIRVSKYIIVCSLTPLVDIV